jgi:hypothetical protein
MRAIPESWLKIGYNLLFTVGFALTETVHVLLAANK